MNSWKLILVLIPVVLVVDLVWLGIVMKNFYAQEIGDLMRRNGPVLAPRWGAAIGVYVLIPVGLVFFVRPLLGPDATLIQAFLYGALFGLVLYGVYDLTNLAVLEKWTLTVTLVDIVWGTVLCGAASSFMHRIGGS